MEWSLILYILLILVIIIFIFKIIKKLIFAVITVIIFVAIIIGAMVGLVYMDLQYFSSLDDGNLDFVVSSGEDYVLGLNFPLKEGAAPTDLKQLKTDDLSSINEEDYSKENRKILVVMPEEVYLDSIPEKVNLREENLIPEIITLVGFEVNLSDHNLEISRDQFLTLYQEGNMDDLIDILVDKNDFGSAQNLIKEPLKNEFDSRLSEYNVDFKGFMFGVGALSTVKTDEGILAYVEAFDEKKVVVEPDLFSLKIIRMFVPAQTIADRIKEN
jgi:hypothetical protein